MSRRVLRRERPSLISGSRFTRLRCGGRDRCGRRCRVQLPWFLGLWRISCSLPDAGYAFPTARPFGLAERCAPWVDPDAEGPARASHCRALAHLVARTATAVETVRPDSRGRSHRRMPERAQFIRSHFPRVASDPSPVRSRLGAERDPSFASHTSPTSCWPTASPRSLARSRELRQRDCQALERSSTGAGRPGIRGAC
jgi:hypothetical protein